MLRQFLALACLVTMSVTARADEKVLDVSNLKTVVDAQGVAHGLGYLGKPKSVHGVLYWAPKPRAMGPLPDTYDLREKGWVAPVRDQAQCGSCWAFSITKTLESALLKAGRAPLDLSEQELVSCDKNAYGCNGGMMDDMGYVVDHGLPLEADYPYTSSGGSTGSCKSGKTVAAKGVRWGYVGAQGREPTTPEIQQAHYDYGVLSVVVAAGGNDWSNGGRMTGCRTSGQNHMVNLIGWTTATWKEKVGILGLRTKTVTGVELLGRNSWGTRWGDNGDFQARQGCDELATGSESVSFVVVDGGPAPTPPHVRLPAEIDILPDTEVMIGVRQETGVQYDWSADGQALPDHDSMIYVVPTKDTVYKITAKTAAGTAESSAKVHVIPQEF